jgi:tRNA(fMet)-specific endonuclease VapC
LLLIDTNIAIHLRDADPRSVSWLADQTDEIAISLITLVELQGGLAKSVPLTSARRRGLTDMLESLAVLPFDRAIVDTYGRIVGEIGFMRTRILDRLIAATALVHDLRLVTNDLSDFRDIPGLTLEVWPSPAQ